jgi:HEAT repeat protein
VSPTVAAAAIVAIAVGCGFLLGLVAWAGVAGRRRSRQRWAQRENAVRHALYRTLDEPGESARIVDDLVAGDRKLLEAKARAILPALRGEDRETLARLLESRGATEVARRKCRSRQATTRAAACQLLGDVGSSFAVLDIVPLLDDHRAVVRVAAARALGRLGQPTGVVPLIGAVDRANRLPVDVAADAIQQIRDWPVSLLDPCLFVPSEPTRALAVELLGRFQAVHSVNTVIDLLESDPATEVRVRAARALGRIGSPHAVQPLIGCVHNGPPALRAEAMAALGRLGAAAAVPTLRATMLDHSQRLSDVAAEALAAIAPQGVAVLESIADEHRHPAGDAARKALAARQAVVAGPLAVASG